MAPLRVIPSLGCSNGSNVDAAPHVIPEGMARFIKDALLDKPGIVRQRGGVDSLADAFPSLPSNQRPVGLTSLPDPNANGAYRVLLMTADYNSGAIHAFIYGRTSSTQTSPFTARSFFFLDTPSVVSQGFHDGDVKLFIDGRDQQDIFLGTQLADITLSGPLFPGSQDAPFFDAKACLDGGVLIGIGLDYGADASASAHRAMWHWRGAGKANYTHDVSVTQNSKTVTGTGTTFTTSLEPGMFLTTSSGRLLGVVASIASDTSLTLEQNVLAATGTQSSAVFKSIRRPYSNAGTTINAGSITAAATSPTINGGGTKFVDQGVANGDLVFRASDNTYVGTVSSVASNEQLTLSASAAVALRNENYLITHAASWSTGTEPVFSAYWNGMQFVINADNRRNGKSERSRIFIAGPENLESVDVTPTGTFYDLPSVVPHSDIRGAMPTESSLLIFLAEETYGLFGNTPDALSPKVLADDGCLAPMTVQSWNGGAVWTGFRGVYLFDGANVRNLLQGRAADTHQRALANLDYTRFRAWSMLYRDHYIVSLEKINNGPFDHEQGGNTVSPSQIIYCINLRTGALTFWTNVHVRGFTVPPGKLVDERDAFFLVENRATTGPAVGSAEALFSDNFSGSTVLQDEVLTNPSDGIFAPQFYLETRLHDMGDPELLKLFKQVQLQHLVYGATGAEELELDVILGLTRETTELAPFQNTTTSLNSKTWKNKRVKFTQRGTHAGFRVYVTSGFVPSDILVGPWAIGFKPQRPGRV